MRILITGATGYIGSAVADVLDKEGHTIVGLARSDRSAAILGDKGFEVLRGDLTDADTLASGAANVDAVIHTAMASSNDGFKRSDILRIAADSSKALMSGLESSGGVFIATGGTLVYGNTGEKIVDETAPLADGLPEEIRALESRILSGTAGVRGVLVRPSVVYGNGGGRGVINLINGIKQLGYGCRFTEVKTQVSAVHVEDLADLYSLSLQKAPKGEIFNAVGELVSTRELIEAAQVAAGVEGDLREPSATDVEALGFMGRYVDQDMRVSAEKAKRVLGWRVRRGSILDDLREGWYREAGESSP